MLWEQDSAPAILLLGSDGAIRNATAGAAALTGHDRATLVGRHLADFFVGEEPRDDVARHLVAASAAGVREERQLQRADGGRIWVDAVTTPLRAPDGRLEGYAFTAFDVTARRREVDGLRQMVDLSMNAIVLVNERGEIISVNAQTERMFGYVRGQLIGRSVELLVPERFRAEHPRNRDAFFRAPVVRPMGAGRDLYGRRADGSEFPVEIGLSPMHTVDGLVVLGSIVDITQRKRAERRFRLAVEAAPNAQVIINREGRIVLVNLQTELLFRYAREELLGELVEILVPERYRDRHPFYREEYLKNPSVRSMGHGRELFGRRKDGSEFPIEIGLNPIETDEEWLVLSAIVDITARKEAEARVRKHLADLAHVARLSTVGQMFSELAHEINQPLAAAANYARACATFAKSDQGPTREQLIEWMDKTAAQTARAIDIVKRLGSFVKKDGGARSLVGINELIEQVVKLSVPMLQTGIDDLPPVELRLELDPSLPCVLVDGVQIEQVLLNLVRNAVEAMQERRTGPHRLTLRSCVDGPFVAVIVADTGPGISEENLSRLFDPYFTTKASGMGLGLSISRSIVEDHDGRLTVESSPSGTTFRFTLPVAKPGTVS